jgi:hypothetical protein
MTHTPFLPERLRSLLLRLTPERFVGASGIAVLCAASAAALLPIQNDPTALIAAQWVGGLGLNVLAGVLERLYLELHAQPLPDEMDRVAALARKLSEAMQHYPALRQEIGRFLGETDALRIAQEVASGNPAVASWLLVQIYSEVMRYQEDFAAIQAALLEIKAALAALEARRHPVPYTGPSLPIQGVYGREDDLRLLMELLQLEGSASNVAPVALRGLGGVGKTILAAALAQQPLVRQFFTGGILWTELGPKPSLRVRLEEWGRLLALNLAAMPDLEACSRRLHAELETRQALLIVDDVWETADGLHFLVGGPRCRVVVTTRELPVAHDLATPHRMIPVDTITPAAAVALLRALAPEVVDSNSQKAEELCARLEYLPLAITLAGRFLANEALTTPRQHQLIAVLLASAEERLALAQHTPRAGIEDVRPSLRAIFALSVERLQPKDQERFALLSWLGGEPLTWTDAMAAAVWDTSEQETAESLTRLLQRGLIEKRGSRYRLHALLADFAEVLRKEQNL